MRAGRETVIIKKDEKETVKNPLYSSKNRTILKPSMTYYEKPMSSLQIDKTSDPQSILNKLYPVHFNYQEASIGNITYIRQVPMELSYTSDTRPVANMEDVIEIDESIDYNTTI